MILLILHRFLILSLAVIVGVSLQLEQLEKQHLATLSAEWADRDRERERQVQQVSLPLFYRLRWGAIPGRWQY